MSVSSEIQADPDAQATFSATCVDEWVRSGVTDAVVCPGSRSTPLALALARDARIDVHVRLDERSAGFFALGASLATGRAVVVCTTSGTAAAELHPAVVEAFHAGVALLVCTANRPPRLQQVSAPQVVEQVGMYGSAVVWSASPGVPRWDGSGSWRSLASRAVAESLYGPSGPGPVHLDLAFDEPLSGTPGALAEGRHQGAPWHQIVAEVPDGSVSSAMGSNPGLTEPVGLRVLFVVGAGCGPPESVLAAAQALNAPVLADPLSGCRARSRGVVAAADAVLRDDTVAAFLRPDLVVRLGGLHASKVLATRLHEWSKSGTRQLLVDQRWRWPDPDRDASTVVRAQPVAWCEEVLKRTERGPEESDQVWFDNWALAESEAQTAIDEWCAGHEEATEPGIARCLPDAVSSETTIVVASSMPIRDFEWYAPPLAKGILSNRGANGIDGVVSTALGAAATGRHPVVAVVGDLAFLHDLTAWVGPRPSDPGAVVVVVDNGGGGIFSFLPQRDLVDHETFEKLFGTPQTIEIGSVARGLGLEVAEVSTIVDLSAAVRDALASGSSRVVVVKAPPRDTNLEHHRSLNAMVTARVTKVLGCSD
jgi:2-succinyl-5-enolpyruvyl-6-hydroxy-3-cyclohexene-1-carboxylate synthase